MLKIKLVLNKHRESLELKNSLSAKSHGKGECNIRDVLIAEQEHLPWQACLWAAGGGLHEMGSMVWKYLEVSLHAIFLREGDL